MRRRRLTDPLRRPIFRRLATTYAVNELGDWMGIIALSVLVFDRTDSVLATAGLFLGTRFLPALLAPILVARAERPPPQAEPEQGRMRDRVRAGLAYIREKAVLRRLLVAQGAAFVFFAAVIPVEVVYVKQTLGASDSGYGLMLASWGLGMVLGSFVFAAVRRAPLAVLLFFSTLAVGAGYLRLAAAASLAVACVGSVLGGTRHR